MNLLAFLSVFALMPYVAAEGWETKIKLELTNDFNDFTFDACPDEAVSDLKAELYVWVKDELLSIFGQDRFFDLSEIRHTNEHAVITDHVDLEADFNCKLCGQKQWSTEKSIHNVAYLLHWFTQLAMEDWIEENEDILEGCMDEGLHINLKIERLGDDGKIFSSSGAKFSDKTLNTISMLKN